MNQTDKKYFCDIDFTECVIAEGVTRIPALFFANRKQLSKVVLPNSLVTIGQRAFQGCESITELPALPKKINFHQRAFSGTGIKHLVAPYVDNYGYVSSGWGSDPSMAFADCKHLQTVVYPEGITNVCESWFSGCTSLTDVELSKDVKIIRSNAFYDCSSLVNINLENVEQIGWGAFEKCVSLKHVTIQPWQLGSDAFRGCTGLESVTIHRSKNYFVSWGDNIFRGCPNLLNIYCNFAEGEIAGAPWGASDATIHYNSTGPEDE